MNVQYSMRAGLQREAYGRDGVRAFACAELEKTPGRLWEAIELVII